MKIKQRSQGFLLLLQIGLLLPGMCLLPITVPSLTGTLGCVGIKVVLTVIKSAFLNLFSPIMSSWNKNYLDVPK